MGNFQAKQKTVCSEFAGSKIHSSLLLGNPEMKDLDFLNQTLIWGRRIGEQEGQHDIAQNHMGFVSHVFGLQISDVSYSLITALNHPVITASQMIIGPEDERV